MLKISLKFSCIILLILIPPERIYGAEKSTVGICLGYENLIPLNKPSDFFSYRKKERTTEIQNGNGIIGSVSYYAGPKLVPFFQTGYHWHKPLKTDTIIDSAIFSNEVYYRTIPLVLGLDYTLFTFGKNFCFKIGADINYNIMHRYSSISNNSETSSTINNFGYSFSINPTLLFGNFKLNCHFGYAKKGDFHFKYINFLIPLYPDLFSKNK